MNKIIAAVFLLLCLLAHTGLTFAVVVSRLDCGVQVHCIGLFNKVAGALLSFPLGLLVWAMECFGIDPAVVADTIFGGEIFVLCIFNSVLAVMFFWFVFIRRVGWFPRPRRAPEDS
ncbi:hypothetical protein ACVWWJ_002686 [Luteibacter sp. HA06]